MGDTTLPTTAPELGSIDGSNDFITSNHAVTAFLQLAQDLEFYIDDLVWRPTYHRFFYLPIELRYRIYEEYILSDSHSLATQTWPRFWLSRSSLRKRSSTPFLPELCLSSKALLKEAGSFLLAATSFEFPTLSDLMYFLNAAAQISFPDLVVAQSIRKLAINNANNLQFAQSAIFNGHRITTIDERAVEVLDRSLNVALNICQELHLLSITFYALAELTCDDLASSEVPVLFSLPISGGFMDGFNVKSILRLKNLQGLALGGISGRRNLTTYNNMKLDEVQCKEDRVKCLRSLSRSAEKIKEGFRAQRQNVEIRTYLYW